MNQRRKERLRLLAEQAATAIDRCKPLPAGVVATTMTKVRLAFHHLSEGSGNDGHFDDLGGAINLGLIRAESIAGDVVASMKAAIEAMVECDALRQRHGRYGFTGKRMNAVREALDYYEEILQLSTTAQMQAALDESYRRMRTGNGLAEHRATS